MLYLLCCYNLLLFANIQNNFKEINNIGIHFNLEKSILNKRGYLYRYQGN